MAAEANLSLLRQHAAVILARQSAMRAVRRRIKAQGQVKLGSLPFSTLSRLANEWLDDPATLDCSPPSWRRCDVRLLLYAWGSLSHWRPPRLGLDQPERS
jgi:hypothetical protein